MEKNITADFQQKMAMAHFMHMKDKIEIFNALQSRFGEGIAEVIEIAECDRAKAEWRNIAAANSSGSLDDLDRLLWQPLKSMGFEYTLERGDNYLKYNCTKCPIFEMAKKLPGGSRWMYHHTCRADFAIAEGFNPSIELTRKKTLMRGDECCDHLYVMKS